MTTLQNALRRKRIAHAYLFSGPRGVGKTTTARVFAQALNCEKGPLPEPCNECSQCLSIQEGRSLDVLEIDGASNRGIEEVRALRENIKFTPSQARYKIYIIDEVHMLTIEAFNALLKTLEEPPPHAIFIFATTAPHKVPLTILSRCQRFDFWKIPERIIVEKLREISREEKIPVKEEALELIAESSDGSLRDAESILDQLSSFVEGEIGETEVNLLLGRVERRFLMDFWKDISEGKWESLWRKVERILQQGKPLESFLEDMARFLKDALLYRLGVRDVLPGEENWEKLLEGWREEEIVELIEKFLRLRERVRRTDVPVLTLQVGLLELIREERKIEKEKEEVKDKILKKSREFGKTLHATLSQSRWEEKGEEVVVYLPCTREYFSHIPGREKLLAWVEKNLGRKLVFHCKTTNLEEGKKYDKIVETAMELFNAKVVREERNG